MVDALRVSLLAVLLGITIAAQADDLQSSSGLPPLKDHPDPKVVAIGKKLFFDKRLSKDGTMSCSACHIPEKAFSDGLPLAKGVSGQFGTRNTPSLLNAAFLTHEFWDGRRDSLEHQALDPMLNPREQGLKNTDNILRILSQDSDYKKLFTTTFTDENPITVDHVASALSAYERSLVSGDSAFDRYQYANDKTALNDSQIRGLELFQGRAQCASCHVIGESSALLTDNDFHRLGVGFGKIEKQMATLVTQIKEADPATLDRLVIENPDIAELGRFVVTKQVSDIGLFKTPSLRNVELTAPYMHDGSVATLPEAIDREIYYRSAEQNYPLILSIQEREDLLNFLKTLTSNTIPRIQSTVQE